MYMYMYMYDAYNVYVYDKDDISTELGHVEEALQWSPTSVFDAFCHWVSTSEDLPTIRGSTTCQSQVPQGYPEQS